MPVAVAVVVPVPVAASDLALLKCVSQQLVQNHQRPVRSDAKPIPHVIMAVAAGVATVVAMAAAVGVIAAVGVSNPRSSQRCP